MCVCVPEDVRVVGVKVELYEELGSAEIEDEGDNENNGDEDEVEEGGENDMEIDDGDA